MTSNLQRKKGFTFVEVLVALIIIAVGVAGLVSLQRLFLQSSTRAAERVAAMEMAQEKLEELRFTPYENLAAGTLSATKQGKTYQLAWTVTGQYLVSGAWVPSGSPSVPSPLPSEPDAKAVAITVSWTERAGGNESLTLGAWLNSVEARDGGLAVTQPNTRQQPSVIYNPGAAPEVVAIELTDDDDAQSFFVKETTKPAPEVQRRGDKLQVRFDTVTYDEATQTQRIEDFVTVNCSCRFQGINAQGKTPARLILEGDHLVLDPNGSQSTTKMVGVPADTNQPELCTICCRDHHDNTDMVRAGNVYRQEGFFSRTPSGDHRHFTNVNGYLQQAGIDDVYEESCRLRRVDGYYVAYPDWRLQAITVMSSQYLVNAATNENYADYVRDVVRAAVLGQSMPTAPDNRDIDVVPGSYQLIGRAVYVDTMSADHLEKVRTAISADETNWLTKVPLYEVNLTLLGDWESTNATVAPITNEAIQTIVDPENNYYGTYSRGRLQALFGGASTVAMAVGTGNGSILDSAPIHPYDQNVSFENSMLVTIDDDDNDDVQLYSITGEVNCLFYKVKGNSGSWESCKSSDFRHLVINSSEPNVTCEFQTIGNTATASYSCPGIREGTSMAVSFGYTSGNATFTPQSVSVQSIDQNVIQNTELRIN